MTNQPPPDGASADGSAQGGSAPDGSVPAGPAGKPSRRSILRASVTGVTAALAGGIGAGAAFASPSDTSVPLPAATGPHPVGTRTFHLVDDRREDPFAPTPTPRELMIQVWYTAAGHRGLERARYLTPGLEPVVERRFELPEGSLGSVRTGAWQDAPAHPRLHRAPVVFFGPGRQDPAATGTAFAQDLASHGYVVIGVNHTYDGPTQFPDGRIIPQDPATGDQALLRKYSDVRAADLSFVLDVLTGQRATRLPAEFSRAPHHTGFGVFGHSLGGSAAAEALRTDQRFTAGACLDGALQTDAVKTGLGQPFLLFTEPMELPTWTDFMAHHTAWGRRMVLAGARHYSFNDLAALGVGLRLDQAWTAERHARFFGTAEGRRSQAVTGAYVRAFFDHWLRGRATTSPSLDAPDADYPEITIGLTSGN
ncbi:alpha/beta hydrolase [Streptomyces alboflavus]|uniref:alpha/beta hydrolase n=1 Tax=Streptomyces alboflavus TaxID=67267 RepID=UPI0036C5ED58